MGVSCSKCGRRTPRIPKHPSDPSEIIPEKEILEIVPEEMDEVSIDAFITKMKYYHQLRMREELDKDPQTFILDNFLMCVQFFDNFDKSMDTANRCKRSMEKEMTELLADDPLEGMILGDRKMQLLTGMSNVLSQNYIYRGKDQSKDDMDELDMYYGGLGFKDTFIADGILPLEFTMTWNNLELYDSSEWNNLLTYAHANQSLPVARFCMEQPDKNADSPKGYIRLRCVDEPIGFERQQSYLHPEVVEDPVYSKPNSDVFPDVLTDTDSEESAANSSSSEEEDTHIRISTDYPVQKEDANAPHSSKSRSSFGAGSSTSRPKLPKLQIPQVKFTEKNDLFPRNPPTPKIHIQSPTPPARAGSFQQTRALFEQRKNDAAMSSGFLFPIQEPERILNDKPNRDYRSKDSPGKETSSGYESNSTRASKGSSSAGGSMMRDKWQTLNLKKLWQFGKKTRKREVVGTKKYDPIPQDCYEVVKLEVSYIENSDEDEDLESYTESDGDSSDAGVGGLNLKRRSKRRKDDEQSEARRYLNSVQIAANSCSEFHYIGPKISIPAYSLQNAVVLGATIRCPIPYTFPADTIHEDIAKLGNYYITYSFTPSLHSKTWPKNLYQQFKNQTLSNARRNNVQGEIWPSRAQLDQMKTFGCSAIPLGYRSVDFFHAEQMLEWELNFQSCETILLNSFKSSHWRAYIFTAILSRAFIAPLGPQGIGLEHVRNVLYFMCNENFSLWNDEQPGAHLKILLQNLFNCLSRGNMPSFFIRSRNLLQSIPEYNIRLIQGHLSQIKENLIVYCIYAFRNIMDVRKTEESYSFPNYKLLYDILTLGEGELLKIKNPILRMEHNREDEEERKEARKRARKKRLRQQQLTVLQQQDKYDKDYLGSEERPKRDRVQERFRRQYEREEHKRQGRQKENQRLKEKPDFRLPEAEKRRSIDLKKSPPTISKKFGPFRVLLAIQFFIQQFLKMAERATELKSYDLATMYVLQVENLCEIAKDEKYKDVASPFDEGDFEEYQDKTLSLWRLISRHKFQYVKVRVTQNSQKSKFQPPTPILSTPPLVFESDQKPMPTFTNNWNLRKLSPAPAVPPAPPAPQAPPPLSRNEHRWSGKTLSRPNIVGSLRSLEHLEKSISAYSVNNNLVQNRFQRPSTAALPKVEEKPAEANRKPRRQESIKFVSPMVHRNSSASSLAPPHRNRPGGRAIKRQDSTFSIAIEESN